MTEKEPSPERSSPPAPPGPEMLRPAAPHVPLTPMMEFFQRRLESMERDLAAERERSRAAEAILKQQEALSGEVEAQMRALTDQLRREKTERESEESKSHARGRIDALEKRLDDMHGAWVALIKEAIGQKDSGTQAAVKQEISALSGTVNALIERIGKWRAESSGLGQVLPEMRALADRVAGEERRFEAQMSQLLSGLSSEIHERLSGWERRQALESDKQEEKLQALVREKAAMLEAIEAHNHAIRQESVKERVQSETRTAEQVGELARRLEDLKAAQERAAKESGAAQAQLARVAEILNTPPKAKDQVIAALEMEKADLVNALKARAEALQRQTQASHEIEATMSRSLVQLNGELDEERQKNRLTGARISELELEAATLKDKLDLGGKTAAEDDERYSALAAERDQLVLALAAEAMRARDLMDLRARSEEEWLRRFEELQKKVSAEAELRAREASTVSGLRLQIGALSEQMTKALQERDAVVGRYAAWDKDRERLLAALKEKDETISMLNRTFQNMLKKP